MVSIIELTAQCLNIYKKLSKNNKEIINYLIVGGLTTVVSIGSYWISRFFIESYATCNMISWILSVMFAYITNKTFVFHSKNKNKLKEIIDFLFSRVLTLLAEFTFLYIMVDILIIDDRISKVFVQILVIILNYIFSKLFVFKSKD